MAGGTKIDGDPNDLCGVSEHSHQVALMAAVAQYVASYPELKWLYANANGGSRGDGTKRGAMIAGGTMKAEGVKAGVSDLTLPVARHGYHGFYIEMKKPGGRESAEQIEFGAFVASQGFLYACFDHWAKAFRAVLWYMGIEHCKAWAIPQA